MSNGSEEPPYSGAGVRLGFLRDWEEVEAGGYVLRVRHQGSWRLYERVSSDGSVEASTLVALGVRVLLAPYPPFLLPVQDLLSCLYVRLESPVVIPPQGRVSFTIPVPFDYAVIAASGGSHNLIDLSPRKRVPPRWGFTATS